MGTCMKENGKKTYNMGMAFKNIQIKMSILEDFFVEASLEKDNIGLQIIKFIKALFTMGSVMVMAN